MLNFIYDNDLKNVSLFMNGMFFTGLFCCENGAVSLIW